MKITWKTKMTNSRRTSRGPVPGRGPAVKKHCCKLSSVIKWSRLWFFKLQYAYRYWEVNHGSLVRGLKNTSRYVKG